VDRRGNSAGQSIAHPGSAHAVGARLLEYVLAAGIFLGSFALWVVVPFGSLWLASKIGDDAETVVFAALFICPIAMLASGLGLSWMYGQYLRVTGTHPSRDRTAWLGSLSGERKRQRARRPILDTSLTISASIAIVLLLLWFFFLAENYSPAGFIP
jgi:hypothetical protein